MYGQLLELAHIREQEYMQKATMVRMQRAARRQSRRSRARRAWGALWPLARTPREGSRVALSTGVGEQICSEC